MNRIVQVDNFQNMACVCANFEEFVDELAEWGVDHAAGIDFDDPELDIPALDRFIKAENGYVREVAYCQHYITKTYYGRYLRKCKKHFLIMTKRNKLKLQTIAFRTYANENSNS